MWINPDKVILTSNYNPRLWYQGATEDSGWQRRIADSPTNPVHVQYVGSPMYSADVPTETLEHIWREDLPLLGVTGTTNTCSTSPGPATNCAITKTLLEAKTICPSLSETSPYPVENDEINLDQLSQYTKDLLENLNLECYETL